MTLVGLLTAAASAREASFADFDRRAREGARLNVVFFGCSLTWGANASDPHKSSYRAIVSRRLIERYPGAHFTFHDAAIGGTNSQLGVFRLDRDVLAYKPDLVFVDFSANDGITDASKETLASYEAIVRRIITEAGVPVVQVIFPFRSDIERGGIEKFVRRQAHLALSDAYQTGVGDAIALVHQRVSEGAVSTKELWPLDGSHPVDAGYALFADAAWTGLLQAIESKRVCRAPASMLHADTYMTSRRVPLSALAPLPPGWTASRPSVKSPHYDMLMSRWLDELTIASPGAAPLRVAFKGSMLQLFGEGSPMSGKYRVTIDDRPPREIDAGALGRRSAGTVHHFAVLVYGLDPATEHTAVIEPLLAEGQTLHVESLCVAGGEARIRRLD